MLCSNEQYSQLIDEAGLDKDSIVNYMVQDYNEFSDLWSAAIVSVLSGESCESLWLLSKENIIKGRKIRNSIYINKKLSRNSSLKKKVYKKERTRRFTPSEDSCKERIEKCQKQEELVIINKIKSDKRKIRANTKSDDKVFEKVKGLAKGNFDDWQLK